MNSMHQRGWNWKVQVLEVNGFRSEVYSSCLKRTFTCSSWRWWEFLHAAGKEHDDSRIIKTSRRTEFNDRVEKNMRKMLNVSSSFNHIEFSKTIFSKISRYWHSQKNVMVFTIMYHIYIYKMHACTYNYCSTYRKWQWTSFVFYVAVTFVMVNLHQYVCFL